MIERKHGNVNRRLVGKHEQSDSYPIRKPRKKAFAFYSRDKPSRATQDAGRLQVLLRLKPSLDRALRERAQATCLPLNTLLRDVLYTWLCLVQDAEAQAGSAIGSRLKDIEVPERYAGYRDSLYPIGDEPSHLDPTPLGLMEL